MSLTAKQEKFALAYVKTTNASEAYRTAYSPKKMTSKTINEEASRLLANPKVAARVKELIAPTLERHETLAEQYLEENRRIALFDPRKLYDADGKPKKIHELDDETASVLASVEETSAFGGKDNSVMTRKIRLWDKGAAIERGMRHLGLFEKDNRQRDPVHVEIELIG